jgi:hypothetical protein
MMYVLANEKAVSLNLHRYITESRSRSRLRSREGAYSPNTVMRAGGSFVVPKGGHVNKIRDSSLYGGQLRVRVVTRSRGVGLSLHSRGVSDWFHTGSCHRLVVLNHTPCRFLRLPQPGLSLPGI